MNFNRDAKILFFTVFKTIALSRFAIQKERSVFKQTFNTKKIHSN